MEYYATDAPGCGGVLRSSPEDFLVEEIYEDLRYEGGRYLVLDVEKREWDTHNLVRELARQLGISQKRFSWAGTKDKRAVTRQRMSVTNLEERDLARIRLPDVKIRVLGRTNRPVGLGDLLGNRFKIRIRDVKCTKEALAGITLEIEKLRGLPNYFGVQRFGDARPVTHLVGRALVHGNAEEAAFTYLALPFPRELEATRQARQRLWEEREIRSALKEYPSYLHYEVAMLNYLAERPGDYAGCFDALAPNLRRLFVHAYQSYIFNRILSIRLRSGLPLESAVPGDVVCFTRGDLPDPSRLQLVDEKNLEAVNRLASRGRAQVTLPLIGFESQPAGGVEGEIERAVLQEEGVSPEDFRVPANPGLGSRGAMRAALLRVSPGWRIEGGSALLEFFLPAGSYATVVLREYMKSGSLITE
jgi:tRNA pseudouridine13 synthase